MEIRAVINGVRIGNLRFADDIAALAENEADSTDLSGQDCRGQQKNGNARKRKYSTSERVKRTFKYASMGRHLRRLNVLCILEERLDLWMVQKGI